jgi:acyl CoA:acetate/3-ketoacid CoA transferase alpha subunit/acyl CoA:acetate/3-ketoacid CoA transferase beta subunit
MARQDKTTTLKDAISAHVCAGDTLCFGFTHNRSHAAAYEVARQFRDTRSLTLVATGLLEYASVLVSAGVVAKLESAFAGNTYPAPSPSRVLQDAYSSHPESDPDWTNLTMTLRLMAGAMGWPFVPVNSLAGSDLWRPEGRAFVRDPFGGNEQAVVPALVPDVAFLHAPIADTGGNAVIHGPDAEESWAAFAARKVIVTAERVVSPDQLRALGPRQGIPGHLVAAVVEAPFGAHPQGQFVWTEEEGVPSYAEDYDFRQNLRKLSRDPEALRGWIEEWVFENDHASYLSRLGAERLESLRESAISPVSATPRDADAPASAEERAAVLAMRMAEARAVDGLAESFFAGIGLSHLAAWGAERRCRERGLDVALIAETGMVGFRPVTGDPYLFNRPNAASSRFHASFLKTLGVLAGPRAKRCLSLLAAGQIDSRGFINSSRTGDGRLIVGSGGANDLAGGTSDVMIVMPLKPGRYVDRLPFTTSPIRFLAGVATDLAWLERGEDGRLEVAGIVVATPDAEAEARAAIDAATGGTLRYRPDLIRHAPPTPEEIALLRGFDPARVILG